MKPTHNRLAVFAVLLLTALTVLPVTALPIGTWFTESGLGIVEITSGMTYSTAESRSLAEAESHARSALASHGSVVEDSVTTMSQMCDLALTPEFNGTVLTYKKEVVCTVKLKALVVGPLS